MELGLAGEGLRCQSLESTARTIHPELPGRKRKDSKGKWGVEEFTQKCLPVEESPEDCKARLGRIIRKLHKCYGK